VDGEGPGLNLRRLSVAELARRLNGARLGEVVTDRSLRDLLTRIGSSVGSPRSIDLFAYLAWLANHRKTGSDPAELPEQRGLFSDDLEDLPAEGKRPIDFWNAEWKKVRTLAARQAFLVQKGDLIARAEVEVLLADRAAAIKQGLDRIDNELPPLLAPLDNPRDIRALLRDRHRALLRSYARPIDRKE